MTVRITPLHQGDMVELSGKKNTFRRQILPFGRFNYKGREYNITPEWADNAIQAFKDRAVAQTWFHLADERNSHKVDNRPDRYGGEVAELVKTDNGLEGVYTLTDKVAGLVRENPKLGVSARFTENYMREADNKRFPVVIDQVLGTLNPKIINDDMWREVTLSEVAENETVEDSSGEEWNVTAPNGQKEGTVPVNKEEYNELLAYVKAKRAEDAELEKLLGTSDSGSKETKTEPEKVGLSNEASTRIAKLSQEVADSRFDRDALEWKQAGVPPHIVELARPVLSSYEDVNVVTLSQDGATQTSDAKLQMRKILDELKGTVKLSNERGHGQTQQQDGDKGSKEEDDLLAAWDKGMV